MILNILLGVVAASGVLLAFTSARHGMDCDPLQLSGYAHACVERISRPLLLALTMLAFRRASRIRIWWLGSGVIGATVAIVTFALRLVPREGDWYDRIWTATKTCGWLPRNTLGIALGFTWVLLAFQPTHRVGRDKRVAAMRVLAFGLFWQMLWIVLDQRLSPTQFVLELLAETVLGTAGLLVLARCGIPGWAEVRRSPWRFGVGGTLIAAAVWNVACRGGTSWVLW
jgi:hypothetical protein